LEKKNKGKSLDAVSYAKPLFMVFHPEPNKQRHTKKKTASGWKNLTCFGFSLLFPE